MECYGMEWNFMESSSPLFFRLNWLSLTNQVKYQSLIYIYKSINGFGSNYMRDIFEVNTNRTTGRRGRNRLFINPPQVKKNYLLNSIFCEGVKYWNSLPLDIRSKGTFAEFITELKNFNLDLI